MSAKANISSMRVSSEMLAQVQNWFRERNLKPECPICKATEWHTFNHIVTPLVWDPAAATLASTAYPTLTLVCSSCGAMQSFSAVTLGLIPNQPNSPTGPETPDG